MRNIKGFKEGEQFHMLPSISAVLLPLSANNQSVKMETFMKTSTLLRLI